MGLDKILSISGKPGLYELKAQTRSGFIAESLLDAKKISVSIRQNVSMLSEIAIYTHTEEVPLRNVFQKIKEKEDGGEAISHKESAAKLESYFKEVLPDYDENSVYASDIKKVIQWYNLLHKNGITDFSEAEEETKEENSDKAEADATKANAEENLVEKAPAKSKKAADAKKAADKKSDKE